MTLDLPWPPSVNHYWARNRNGSMRVDAAGVAFQNEVAWRAHLTKTARFRKGARLRVTVGAYPPDKRRRDLDNVLKALLDALVHAGLIEDDGFIDQILIGRFESVKGGRVEVSIEPVTP